MRVSTAFKRLLRLTGASVIDVSFAGDGVVVTVRLRRRRRVCSSCRQTGRLEIHGRRIKRWRHLDLGASRCWIECELRLLPCPDCGVRLEAGGVGQGGRAPHARLRGRRGVAGPAYGVLADHPAAARRLTHRRRDRRARGRRPPRRDRLQGLIAIGVDEISYRRHHRYLTCVADHRTGAIVWCAAGRNSATLQAFFDELGDRKASIRAVSIDMSGEYQRAIRAKLPDAEICF